MSGSLIDLFLRAWKAKRLSPSGHEGRYDLRSIVNAIFYQNRTGCQWAYLPNDLPPWSAVYYYFALWRDTPTVTRAYVDAGFKDDVLIHGAVLGITVEQVKRSDTKPGFVPVAQRWVVEQTHGTLMLHRRLTRELRDPAGLQRVAHPVGVDRRPDPPADR